ncbi:variable surface protein [Plasmodium gonderi]|uniref:Variable surface protein n=1 Tax=Plasmodium gonderi TaxID=77519 RepID=A0A1Y1JT26_PLAGO|nr:variable surface protein [Plasmodium gonderi]GAW83932.1 variable surface protein [Plasmodium gonderi]
MGNSIVLDKNFNFKDIFTKCKDEFNNPTPPDREVTTLCNLIRSRFFDSNDSIIAYCQKFYKYLDLIKLKNNSDQYSYCKYFNFILKDILTKFKFPCNGEKQCYQNIIRIEHKGKKISNTCQDYVDDLDNDTFYILKNLDQLYSDFKALEEDPTNCSSSSKCYNKYRDLLSICQKGKSRNFCEELREFRQKYNDHMKTALYCPCFPKILYDYYVNMTTVILSTLIITFVISFIMLILYRVNGKLIFYTQYGSCFHQRMRNIKRLWNKKSNMNLNLMHLCEISCKQLMDKSYKISYDSLDHS